jgi:hypothetical protein
VPSRQPPLPARRARSSPRTVPLFSSCGWDRDVAWGYRGILGRQSRPLGLYFRGTRPATATGAERSQPGSTQVGKECAIYDSMGRHIWLCNPAEGVCTQTNAVLSVFFYP